MQSQNQQRTKNDIEIIGTMFLSKNKKSVILLVDSESIGFTGVHSLKQMLDEERRSCDICIVKKKWGVDSNE